MKWKPVLWILLAVGLITCTRSSDDGLTSSIESEEIGICGANADPSTGVTCAYWLQDANISLTSSSAVEIDTQDYVRCTWTLVCILSATPKSYDGSQTCLSVVGTGCSSRTENVSITRDFLLPPGTPATGIAAYCSEPNWSTQSQACRAIATPIEQGEDLCCLPRPPPPPPGGDGGVVTIDAATGSAAD